MTASINQRLGEKDASEFRILVSMIIDHLWWDAEAGKYDIDKEVSGADTVDMLGGVLKDHGLVPENTVTGGSD